MLRVIEINSLEELTGYRLAWRSLMAVTRRATFFQSLDWLETYWRHFGELRLRVLVVRSSDEIIGILPLGLYKERTHLGWLRVLTYPLKAWGTFYGPIGSQPTLTLLEGLKHIARTERDWDLLDLRWVDRDQCDRGRTPQAMQLAGLQGLEQPWNQVALVDLAGTWDKYMQSRSRHWRKNLRRSERLLAAQGEVAHVRYRPAGSTTGDDDPRWDLYDACEEIARRSWQGSSTTGTTLSHASIRNYLREAHEISVKAGGMDVNLLYVGNEPVAFAYNYHFQGYVTGLRMGFDAERCGDGGGSVLMSRMLCDSFARGDRVFDLGSDYLECKRPWHTSVVTSYRYTHYPLAVARAQALRVKHVFQGWLGKKVGHRSSS